jgi:hypothetical protein
VSFSGEPSGLQASGSLIWPNRPRVRNVEWRHVRSLLEAAGTVVEEPNGKLLVTLGPETEVFVPPHGKDVDVQQLLTCGAC